jgi:hypothetical protein
MEAGYCRGPGPSRAVAPQMMMMMMMMMDLTSGFRRDVDDICVLLGLYAASCGNCLPTFRDNVSVPSLRVKKRR